MLDVFRVVSSEAHGRGRYALLPLLVAGAKADKDTSKLPKERIGLLAYCLLFDE